MGIMQELTRDEDRRTRWIWFSQAAMTGFLHGGSLVHFDGDNQITTVCSAQVATARAHATADEMMKVADRKLAEIKDPDLQEAWCAYASAALTGITGGCSAYFPEKEEALLMILPQEAAAWAGTVADSMLALYQAKFMPEEAVSPDSRHTELFVPAVVKTEDQLNLAGSMGYESTEDDTTNLDVAGLKTNDAQEHVPIEELTDDKDASK